jgi:hypothetical protein
LTSLRSGSPWTRSSLRRRNDSMTDSTGKLADAVLRPGFAGRPYGRGRGIASPSCSMWRPMKLLRGRAKRPRIALSGRAVTVRSRLQACRPPGGSADLWGAPGHSPC